MSDVKTKQNKNNIKKDAPHAHHRMRMKARYLEEGSDGFSDHEMLEMLLYYAVPRKDTNITAHELINKFGSLKGVFSADQNELMTVNGIKDNASTLIALVTDIKKRAEISEQKCKKFNSIVYVNDYLKEYYSFKCKEEVLMMMFDNSMRLIGTKVIGDGGVGYATANLPEAVHLAYCRKAAYVILAHNHPAGILGVSEADLNFTAMAESKFSAQEMLLIDHIIISDKCCLPIIKLEADYLRSSFAIKKYGAFLDIFYRQAVNKSDER